MKKTKQKNLNSPKIVITIFLILILGIIFKPSSSYKINTNNYSKYGQENQNSVSEEDLLLASSEFYNLSNNNNFKFNELELSNFVITEKEISITIKTAYEDNLEKLDYYIEFFDENKKFIGRRLITGYVTKSTPISLNIENLDINENFFFIISHIEDKVINEGNRNEINQTLTCNMNNYKYDYFFENNQLQTLKILKSESYSTVDDKINAMLEYQKRANELNEIKNVSASVLQQDNTIILISEFNYKDENKFKEIPEFILVDRNVSSGTIKFKMEAVGYECH